MNIFERAARSKLRIAVSGGVLLVENLFELPLTAPGRKLSLDLVAREVHNELKGFDDSSFVETTPEPRRVELQLQLDLIKHVIESKKQDAASAQAAAQTRAQKAEDRRLILEALAQKRGETIKGLSEEDLRKKLAELGE